MSPLARCIGGTEDDVTLVPLVAELVVSCARALIVKAVPGTHVERQRTVITLECVGANARKWLDLNPLVFLTDDALEVVAGDVEAHGTVESA